MLVEFPLQRRKSAHPLNRLNIQTARVLFLNSLFGIVFKYCCSVQVIFFFVEVCNIIAYILGARASFIHAAVNVRN